MRRIDALFIIGVGLLIAGAIFLATDPKLFDHWYDWVFGPFFWLMGCVLMVAWAALRFGHGLSHESLGGPY